MHHSDQGRQFTAKDYRDRLVVLAGMRFRIVKIDRVRHRAGRGPSDPAGLWADIAWA
jgi:transposase InsO family protein